MVLWCKYDEAYAIGPWFAAPFQDNIWKNQVYLSNLFLIYRSIVKISILY